MQEDARKYNGGKRTGAGRKPKSDEQKLIESLAPYDEQVIKILIEKCIEEKDLNAIKLFLSYRFGIPKAKEPEKEGDAPKEIKVTFVN